MNDLPAASRRNVYTAAAANGIGFAGFTIAMPFLPLYIRELGVQDVSDIALWTGLTLGATPAITAFSAPLWGRVGDRFGSKVLVLRSLSAFVLVKAAMGLVTAPWQLLALRALLGVFAGYGSLTVSMAAESVPRERMAEAIGTVQIAQRLGPAIGPLIGGALAPMVGLRTAFFVASGFYAVAVVLITTLYVEPSSRRAQKSGRPLRSVLAELARTPGFPMVFAVILGLQLVDRSFTPILPLYVEKLGLPPDDVAWVSGVLFAVAAFSAAYGHHIATPLVDRYPMHGLVAGMALVTAAGLGLLVAVPSVWVFGLALGVSGVAIGVGMTAAYALGGRLLPPDAHATGFGVMTTAWLGGLAVSPIVAGFISGPALALVFNADMVLLVALAAAAWRWMRPAATRQPLAASDASAS